MLFDTAISIILDRLGNRPDLQTQAENEMRLVQSTLERAPILPWFLLKDYAAAHTIPCESRVALPTDFLRETEEGETSFWLVQPDGARSVLEKRDWASARAKYPGSGIPRQYALVGEYMRLAPIPDAFYQLEMLYYGADTPLMLGAENQWLKHASELLIALTGKKVAMYIQDPGLAGVFEQDAQAAYARLHVESVARNEAGRFRQLGDD